MWSGRRAIAVAAVGAAVLGAGFAVGRATRPEEQVPRPPTAEQVALQEESPRVASMRRGVQVPELRLPRPQQPVSGGGGTTQAPESDGSQGPTSPGSPGTTQQPPQSGGDGNEGGSDGGGGSGEDGGVIGGGID
jgi:hypothetical protein